ncbi:MAG: STAS domain-containing protein [Dongiaceae bacterium]
MTKGAECRVALPARLDPATIGNLHKSLLAAVNQKKPVVIDAEQVSTLSTICVQALVAAAKSFQKRNLPFCIKRPSDAFVATFDGLGLFSSLMSWEIRQ